MNRVIAAAAAALVFGAAHGQGTRPEVGKPLQAAQEMIKGGKYREALGKVREADAVGGKTAAESNLIERMRLAAASGAGEADTAARSYEALAGGMSGTEKLRTI